MIVQSRLFRRDPDWRVDRRGLSALTPETERSWLYESGSLTRRLKHACGAEFGVRVLLEREMPPFPGERNALGGSGTFFVREVLLHRRDTPLVVARTVIPAATLKGKHAGLAHLGSRPLGEVLFACPCLKRLRLEIACVAPDAWRDSCRTSLYGTLRAADAVQIGCPADLSCRTSLYGTLRAADAVQPDRPGGLSAQSWGGENPVWGRRSLYRIASGELLVSEFFLPGALSLEE